MQASCRSHNNTSVFKMQCMSAFLLPIALMLLLQLFEQTIVSQHHLPFGTGMNQNTILEELQIFNSEQSNPSKPIETQPTSILASPGQFAYTSRRDLRSSEIVSYFGIVALFLLLMAVGVMVRLAQRSDLYPKRALETTIRQSNAQTLHQLPPQLSFVRLILILSLLCFFLIALLADVFTLKRFIYQQNLNNLGTFQQQKIKILNTSSKFTSPNTIHFPTFPYYQQLAKGVAYTTNTTSNDLLRATLTDATNGEVPKELFALNYLADTYGCTIIDKYLAFGSDYAGFASGNCIEIVKSVDAYHSDHLLNKGILWAIATILLFFAFFFQCKCVDKKDLTMFPYKKKCLEVFEATILYAGMTEDYFDDRQFQLLHQSHVEKQQPVHQNSLIVPQLSQSSQTEQLQAQRLPQTQNRMPQQGRAIQQRMPQQDREERPQQDRAIQQRMPQQEGQVQQDEEKNVASPQLNRQ